MDPLQTLLAIEDIKQLKARYFRCMDSKDWTGFEAVFADDATLDLSDEANGPGEKMIHGATEIAAFVRSAVGDVETVHHGHTPEIALLSEDSASGVWAMEDMLRWPPGGQFKSLHGYGHYHETYERKDGRWTIKTTRLTRLRLDIDPV